MERDCGTVGLNMSDQPLVSVIIPTYNYSTVLKCAIESILLQTMQDFEILVIGDGCTDDSEEVVKSFGDERIIWENLPENTGNQGLPNNRGLELASGKYVAYLGHDDLFLPTHLARLTETLETHDKLLTASYAIRFGHPNVGTRIILYMQEGHKEFIPGVMMHRRELGRDVKWKHYTELAPNISTNTDFTMRLLSHVGDGFKPTPFLTELNFPATHRPNSYKTKVSDEQEYYIQRIKTEPYIVETLLLETVLAARTNLYHEQKIFGHGKEKLPGEFVEAMRRFKGLESDGRDIQEISVDTNRSVFMIRRAEHNVKRFIMRAVKKIGYEWSKFRKRMTNRL